MKHQQGWICLILIGIGVLLPQTVAFANIEFIQQQIQERQALIDIWEHKARIVGILAVLVAAFAGITTIVQGFQRNWTKWVTALLGICIVIFASVKDHYYEDSRKELLQRANKAKAILKTVESKLALQDESQRNRSFYLNINDDLGTIDRLAVFKPQGSLVNQQLQFIITAAYAAQVVDLSWIKKESFSDENNYYFVGKATHPNIYEAEQLAGESAYTKILKQYLDKMKQKGVRIDLFQGEDLYDSVISAAELINTHVEKSDAGITYYVLVMINKRSENSTLDFYSYLFNQSVTAPSADISTINVDQVVERIMTEVKSMNKGYRRKAFK